LHLAGCRCLLRYLFVIHDGLLEILLQGITVKTIARSWGAARYSEDLGIL
jgi:hypothetical protein